MDYNALVIRRHGLALIDAPAIEARLLAIPQADFEVALWLLQTNNLPEYEECVFNAVARADQGEAAFA